MSSSPLFTLRLPEDLQDKILLSYRQGLHRRMINRAILRIMSQYRQSLDRSIENRRFYTRRRLLNLLLNTLFSGYRTGDLCVLGSRPRAFARRAFRTTS